MLTILVNVLKAILYTVAWFAVAVNTAIIAGTLAGGTQHIIVTLLACLVDWLWIPLALLALLAVCLWSRTLGIALGVLLIGAATVVVPTMSSNPNSPADAQQLTILSQNTELGSANAWEIADAVKKYNVDVLILTELTPEENTRIVATGIPKLLPWKVGMGQYNATGTAMWSRYPLTNENLLPGLAAITPQADITRHGRTITITGVHPNSPYNSLDLWNQDYRILNSYFSGTANRTQVIAGDFNAGLTHDTLKDLMRVTATHDAMNVGQITQVPTWPTVTDMLPTIQHFPLIAIDHVLVSHLVHTLRTGTIEVSGTDHLGIWATIEF